MVFNLACSIIVGGRPIEVKDLNFAETEEGQEEEVVVVATEMAVAGLMTTRGATSSHTPTGGHLKETVTNLKETVTNLKEVGIKVVPREEMVTKGRRKGRETMATTIVEGEMVKMPGFVFFVFLMSVVFHRSQLY